MTGQHGNTQELIAAAIVGRSLREMADAAGVSISTAQRRLREPEVQAAVRDGRRHQRAEATGRLAALRVAALDALAELVVDPDPGTALRAVSLILGNSARFDVLYDLDERIASLETGNPPGFDSVDRDLNATDVDGGRDVDR
jgi:hypothetical protein